MRRKNNIVSSRHNTPEGSLFVCHVLSTIKFGFSYSADFFNPAKSFCLIFFFFFVKFEVVQNFLVYFAWHRCLKFQIFMVWIGYLDLCFLDIWILDLGSFDLGSQDLRSWIFESWIFEPWIFGSLDILNPHIGL